MKSRHPNNSHVAFLSLHPLCGAGDLLFLLSPAAAATCFCSHSKTPTRVITKYLQFAYWPWGIYLVNFFCVLIKTLIFLGFSILADISVLLILAIIKIW